MRNYKKGLGKSVVNINEILPKDKKNYDLAEYVTKTSICVVRLTFIEKFHFRAYFTIVQKCINCSLKIFWLFWFDVNHAFWFFAVTVLRISMGLLHLLVLIP